MAIQIVVCSVRNCFDDCDNPKKDIKSFCKDINKKFNITLDAKENKEVYFESIPDAWDVHELLLKYNYNEISDILSSEPILPYNIRGIHEMHMPTVVREGERHIVISTATFKSAIEKADAVIKQHTDEESYKRLKTGVLDIYMEAAELSLRETLPIFWIY
jgi:hypothetical protein